MEIKAKSNDSFAAHKIFFNITAKQNKTVDAFFKIALLICSALVILISVFFDKSISPLAFLVVICTILYFFFDIFFPRLNYKLTKISNGLKESYIFYDDEMHITTTSKNLNSECDLQYDVLKKVYETKDYIFIYISHQQAYIVDKSTISDGSENELRERLVKAVGEKKYKFKL